MIKNYIKTASRSLAKNKANAFINIAGLVVGFAAFLLIFLVIQYQKSFDDYHTNKDDIYRVVRIGRAAENREYRTGVPFPVSNGLRTDLPQIKNVAAIGAGNNVQVAVPDESGNPIKKFKEPTVFIAEPQFFQMFDYPLATGDIKTALKDVNTVVITKAIAVKYFGDWKQALGKSLKLYGEIMKVNGILENPPANTDFQLSIVVSYATMMKHIDPSDWSSIDDANYCFVQLDKNIAAKQAEKIIDGFTEKRIKPVNPGYVLGLQPLNEIHFDGRYGTFSGVTFSKDMILALTIIGIFLLVIACVNFINITTAYAVNRSREVGVRKVLGGSRLQLIMQFLGETGITTFIALVLSVLLTLALLSPLNNLLGIHIMPAAILNVKFIAFILGALIMVTFLSGFYPAVIMSAFKSITVLKGAKTNSTKGISLRRGLVTLQFIIAQVLIIATLVVASQMDYFRNADMGFNKDAVINASFPGDSLSRTKLDMLKHEISRINGVKQVSLSVFTPAAGGDWATDLQSTERNKAGKNSMIVQMKPGDTAFFNLYKLKLVAGRIYFPSDTIREFVVNEAVVKGLGIQDPQKALGKQIIVSGKTAPIVGVVKDYHTFSLRDAIGPTVMTTLKSNYRVANIKIDMSKSKDVIATLQSTWNKLYPDYIFEYGFLDESIANYYQQENQLSALYKIFSGIAIFISCLGLYGLISFMAVQRRKEIGIRKVLGAPVKDIVLMLSKEFTIVIVIAFLISAPVAAYFMKQWLQQYTYRISMGVWFFVATITGSLLLAWITVGYTAIKAAVANPVKSLRTE